MEKRFLHFISNNIEYIGSVDATISGSRNGHSALYFKHIIDMKGFNGFKDDVEKCLDVAHYLEERIPKAWRNQNSITVVLPRASPQLIDKWQLATQGDLSHVICMPHVTKDKLDLFIDEYCSQK
jgi:histidine decarboxylase